MKHYILNLEGCLEETAEWIIQNIRFWCFEIKRRGESAIYDITSSCDFSPEFLFSKGIPANCITPA